MAGEKYYIRIGFIEIEVEHQGGKQCFSCSGVVPRCVELYENAQLLIPNWPEINLRMVRNEAYEVAYEDADKRYNVYLGIRDTMIFRVSSTGVDNGYP